MDAKSVGIRVFLYKSFHALKEILREIPNNTLELNDSGNLF